MVEEIQQEEQAQESQEQGQQEARSPEDAAILAQAKLFGYKEEYDGPNKLTPGEYINRAYERLDIARGTIKTIERTNADLMAQNKNLAGKLDTISTTFKQFVENSRKAEERAYERAKRELEAKMEQAVEDSDTGAFKKAKADLDMLEAQIKEHPALTGKEIETKETTPTAQEMDWYNANPEAYIQTQQEWIESNPWYETEIDMAMYADGVDRALSKSKIGRAHKTQQERLTAIAEAVKKKFPEFFGEKPVVNQDKPKRAGAVEEGGREGPPGSGGKKTYADLPREAKHICDELVAEGILTKEDYVNNYQWE